MKRVSKRNELREEISLLKSQGKTIGFVPTMGALHSGHIALVKRAREENDIVVVSVFVNPAQFNNTDDLKKYPRDIESDAGMLTAAGCDYMFIPSVEEMYPDKVVATTYDFGNLSKVMEGANRPGHFDGVATVVSKLFDIIPATRAYFGEKDYQQLLIIKSLVKQRNIDTEIVPCAIVREDDGLAMSSRNRRLSAAQRVVAPLIYQTLRDVVKFARNATVQEVKKFVEEKINAVDGMQLEYFEVADASNLEILDDFEKNKNIMGFIVVNLGTVRLIDNIKIF